MMTHPTSSMLTSIRNGVKARRSEVIVPKSSFKLRLAEILKKEGFVSNVETINDGPQGSIKITLKYADEERREAPIHEVKIVSKPGQRMYVAADSIPHIKQGLGVAVISTSQGLMTGFEAKKRKLGGELICQIW